MKILAALIVGAVLGFIAGLYRAIPLPLALMATGHKQALSDYTQVLGAERFSRLKCHTVGNYLVASSGGDLVVAHSTDPKMLWLATLDQPSAGAVIMMDNRSEMIVGFDDRNADGRFDMLSLTTKTTLFADTNFDGWWDVTNTNYGVEATTPSNHALHGADPRVPGP